MDWARVLAYVTGTVDQELLARNEISGRRKPHSEDPAERTAQALGRRASHARRDWSSPRPQSPRRGRNCGEARYYPGLAPQACRQQVRWLESPSRPRQTADEARSRAAHRAPDRGEPSLGL